MWLQTVQCDVSKSEARGTHRSRETLTFQCRMCAIDTGGKPRNSRGQADSFKLDHTHVHKVAPKAKTISGRMRLSWADRETTLHGNSLTSPRDRYITSWRQHDEDHSAADEQEHTHCAVSTF